MTGTGCFAASAANSPYPRRRPLAWCSTSCCTAFTSDTGTDQRAAAAASSIWRAAAPTRRMGTKKCRTLRDPSTFWLPYRASSPSACTTFTRSQRASISSATTMGRLVRTPVPISARWATMVTVPSAAIETKTSGSCTVPPGMVSAPYFGGGVSAAEAALTSPWAVTARVNAPTLLCRNPRRES